MLESSLHTRDGDPCQFTGCTKRDCDEHVECEACPAMLDAETCERRYENLALCGRCCAEADAEDKRLMELDLLDLPELLQTRAA